MLHPDMLPAQCSNSKCGYTFVFPNPFGGFVGAYSSFAGNSTSCPKCRASAAIMDFSSDQKGKIIYSGAFMHLRKIKDPEKLDHLRKKLEAANENFSADELNQALAGANTNLKNIIPKNISPELLISIIALIVAVIGILQNQLNFQKQHNLEIEKFEFEQQNNKDEAQISTIIEQLESYLNDASKKAAPTKKQPHKKIKNCERNKPCPCGSNKKSKDCHIHGYTTPIWT
jgi:hypothetical protein